jgi:hypothetical protein
VHRPRELWDEAGPSSKSGQHLGTNVRHFRRISY